MNREKKNPAANHISSTLPDKIVLPVLFKLVEEKTGKKYLKAHQRQDS
jgi:hypothetical protein